MDSERKEVLKAQGANIAEMSLLYCLESDFLFENKLFDDAYKWAMDALRMDSERKEVLELMIKIYSPRIEIVGSAQIENDINPYVDDEKAKECAINLESLYSHDPDALYSAASCYSSLGLYDDALRVLKQSFFKITSPSKAKHDQNQMYSKEMVDEIKKTITQTFINRYSSCDNQQHQKIIHYLIELVEWKYTDFGPENMKICIGEIWERLEYVLGKHLEKMNDHHSSDRELLEHEWMNISDLLSSIPCSIPLSSKLLAQIVDILHVHRKYYEGIQFFTRLITEYQTYSDNMGSIYAKFEKYDILYLHRAKLYQAMGQVEPVMDDIEEANTRRLCNDNTSERITVQNLMEFMVIDDEEEPLIETVDQIKKRRASRISASNIMISPMPRQYQDFHLTPKSKKKSSKTRPTTGRRRRYKSVASGFAEAKETEEDTEKFSTLESTNRALQNRIVDLKNDLRRESAKARKDREEMERLQSKITALTNDLNHSVIEQVSETLPQQGEGDEIQESGVGVPESVVQDLKKQNETYQEKMEAMRRELKILKDCQSKMKQPKKQSTGSCWKMMQFLIGITIIALAFAGVMVHFYGWETSNEFLIGIQADLEREMKQMVEASGPFIEDCWKYMDEVMAMVTKYTEQMMMEVESTGGDQGVYKGDI